MPQRSLPSIWQPGVSSASNSSMAQLHRACIHECEPVDPPSLADFHRGGDRRPDLPLARSRPVLAVGAPVARCRGVGVLEFGNEPPRQLGDDTGAVRDGIPAAVSGARPGGLHGRIDRGHDTHLSHPGTADAAGLPGPPRHDDRHRNLRLSLGLVQIRPFAYLSAGGEAQRGGKCQVGNRQPASRASCSKKSTS